MKKLNEILLKIFDNIMFVTSAMVCILILIGAFMRYVLKMDFYGSEEIILLTAFWMYFVGSAVATYHGSHISADLITSSLKNNRHKSYIFIIQEILSIILFALLTWLAFNFNAFSVGVGQKTPVYKIPMVVAYSSVLISFVLSTIYSVINLRKRIGGLNEVEEVNK